MARKIIVTALAVVVLLTIAYFVKVRTLAPSTSSGHQVAAPSVSKPTVPSGRQEYNIAQAAEARPPIRNVVIDPPDVHVGNTQHLSITVEADAPLAQARAEIETDHGTKTLTLTEEKMEKNLRTYSGSWIVQDTHDTTYHTKFVVQDAQGHENSFIMAWSDACSIPQSGSWTLNSACTISSTDGVDNGNATIGAGGSLTLNAVFAYNSGQSITISGGGTVAVGSGQGFRQTYLWQVDADADGYPASSTEYAQASAPTNGLRRYLLSGSLDCNDGNASLFQNLTGYQDSDGDTFTIGSPQQVCSGASLPAGWAATSAGTDCYDANANAKPGQTAYFVTNRGDGSFDYNCDAVTTKDKATYYSTCSDGLLGNNCSVACINTPTCNYGGSTATPACGSSYTQYDDTDASSCTAGATCPLDPCGPGTLQNSVCSSKNSTVACR